jgi:ATP-dependent RNA helicase DOB1
LESEYNALVIDDQDTISEYYHLRVQLNKLKENMREIIHQPLYALPFLQPGRLVRVRDVDEDWGWGVVVNFQKKQNMDKAQSLASEGLNAKYIVDVLLNCAPQSASSLGPAAKLKPCPPDTKGEIQVVPVMLHLLDGISALRVYVPKDLRVLENRNSVGKSIQEVMKKFPDGIPLLDPIEDMQIEDAEFKKLIRVNIFFFLFGCLVKEDIF